MKQVSVPRAARSLNSLSELTETERSDGTETLTSQNSCRRIDVGAGAAFMVVAGCCTGLCRCRRELRAYQDVSNIFYEFFTIDLQHIALYLILCCFFSFATYALSEEIYSRNTTRTLNLYSTV